MIDGSRFGIKSLVSIRPADPNRGAFIYPRDRLERMYRTGHIGVALLTYSPIGVLLLVSGLGELAILGGAGMVALAMVPDADHRVPFVRHRGPTHTLLFAAIVGIGLGAAGFTLGEGLGTSTTTLGTFGLVIGALSVLAHLAADALTPAGITPFWPVSGRHYSADVVRAKNPIANYLLFAAGIMSATAALLLAAQVH